MTDIVKSLKHKARILHRQALTGNPVAIAQLRKLPELRSLDEQSFQETVKRRHCLTRIARILGFQGWPHALAVLRGENSTEGYGTLLHQKGCAAHTNIWTADYAEAKAIRAQTDGYLLPYRREYLIAEADYIRTLGLDPAAPEWSAMNRDWVGAPHAMKASLTAKLVKQVLADAKVITEQQAVQSA